MKDQGMSKRRWMALALALAMSASAGVFASADGENPLSGAAQETTVAAEQAAKDAAAEVLRGAVEGENKQEEQKAENAATEAEKAAEESDEPELDPAAAMVAPTATPDAEGTLSFANLRTRMLENYYPLLAIKESIDDVESHDYEWRYENLRKRLNDIGSAQHYLATAKNPDGTPVQTDSSIFQSAYDSLHDLFEDVKKGDTKKDDEAALWQYRTTQNTVVIAGESLFMQIHSLRAQDEQISRGIAKMDRMLKEMELRESLGQVSALSVDQLRNQRTQTASQQQTLRSGIDSALLNLESMVGAELGKPLELGALPKVTAEQLDAMELEKDLEKAQTVSYSIFAADKAIKDFKKGTYKTVVDRFSDNDNVFEVSQVKHALQAMKIDYQNTVQSFELNFRTLYAQVKDAAQILEARRAALASQEKSYAASALKYEQGNLSANALEDAKDELATAKDNVSSAERDLFAKYRSYQWAVEYGILNS